MKTEIKFGIILGLGICAYTLIAHFLGFYTNNIQAGKYGDTIIIILPIVVLFLAIREKRNVRGFLTLLGGIKTGLLTVLVSYPLSTAFLWIYHHYINPSWFENILAYEQKVLENSGLSSAEIAEKVNALRAGNSDFAQIVSGLIGAVVLGLILSFILSLIMRKKRRTDFQSA